MSVPAYTFFCPCTLASYRRVSEASIDAKVQQGATDVHCIKVSIIQHVWANRPMGLGAQVAEPFLLGLSVRITALGAL